MPFQYLSSAMSSIPSAADGVSITPSGAGGFANSSWAEITSSLSGDSLLLMVCPRFSQAAQAEIDIGTGSAGSETVICTVKFTGNTAIAMSQLSVCPFPIAVDNLANGVRIAARVRQSTTTTTAWHVAIQVVAKPITGSLLTTANVGKVSPSAASALATGSVSSAWASGSWAQFVASTSAAWVIWAISVRSSTGGVEYELDIGTGSAGNEVVIYTIHGYGEAGAPEQRLIFFPLPNPLDNIAASTRIAIRARKSDGSGTLTLAASYFEKPL